jgi:CHAT domain-containing protein
LEYVLGDDASYCLVISKNEARIVRLADQQSIQAMATTLIDDVRDNRDGTTAGHALFRALVEPLGDLSQYGSVEISPDGILNTIPFEVLRTASHGYWGFSTTVTYTPSAGTYFLLSNKTSPELSRTFFGIGGVPYDATVRSPATSARRGDANDPYDLSDVHDLPSSEEEIRTAATLLSARPATLEVGDAATKAAFENANLAQYAVLHFAVHARADIANPELSYLLLKAAPPYKDAFLEPRDIMQRDLHSALVVLSACDTAIGHLQGEEGVADLGRSFLIAGSSSVISTLWKIDDTYSLFLMKTFYEHLGRGESTGESLRAAKMAVLATFGQNTPLKLWAGFVLTGNGGVKLPNPPAKVASAHIGEMNDAGRHQGNMQRN